ncbi:MAG: NAD(+) synthase [Flavobacteriales bacterium]
MNRLLDFPAPAFRPDVAESVIVDWLRDYAIQAGVHGFVVGVSGGIDSAVTSTLCALTGLKTHVLDMPIHQAPDQASRSAGHIEDLKRRFPNQVKAHFVDLSQVYDVFCHALPPLDAVPDESEGLALANSRARLRMTTLYALAQRCGCLVAGTGNKVEDFGVGFYTKYGDGGVDLSPIADLMKTEVFQLGAHLQVRSDILTAPPTDGLWGDDRTDEDQLGATYPALEWAMRLRSLHPEGCPEGLAQEQKDALATFDRFHRVNEHKMKPIPVCLMPESVRR